MADVYKALFMLFFKKNHFDFTEEIFKKKKKIKFQVIVTLRVRKENLIFLFLNQNI